jgi:hypothetical protein
MSRRIMNLQEYRLNEMAEESLPFEIDETLLDELVDLVGSEEDVEMAAEEAFNELMAAADNDEIEISEEDVPEKLALSALLVKLVEKGKLGPEDADSFLS